MNGPTLATLFGFDGGNPTDDQLERLRSSQAFATMPTALSRKPPTWLLAGAARAVSRALGGALHVSLADVLIGGWNTYHSLLEYTDRSKHPPEEVSAVALGEHTITSTHSPRVDLLVGGRVVVTVPFEVDLELQIEGAVLTIQDARIKEVATGKCVGQGTVKCGGAVLLDRTSDEIPLPGRLDFGGGIPIVPQPERGTDV